MCIYIYIYINIDASCHPPSPPTGTFFNYRYSKALPRHKHWLLFLQNELIQSYGLHWSSCNGQRPINGKPLQACKASHASSSGNADGK